MSLNRIYQLYNIRKAELIVKKKYKMLVKIISLHKQKLSLKRDKMMIHSNKRHKK